MSNVARVVRPFGNLQLLIVNEASFAAENRIFLPRILKMNLTHAWWSKLVCFLECCTSSAYNGNHRTSMQVRKAANSACNLLWLVLFLET